ncbi:DUF4157 domain-containing protein [Spirosoma taeanense]|uniref:DUF4157 domain-containing protein n=1 Tax=Spirosoma taeanense TaxID=2735870 RepID=A0A6M5Y5R5_9BACT|nr:DUF4157 domain-containing protein [Spirosoma taeanense]QJW89145.1 DUF4157 domain-containing protein [Spirosoma taeanense]
MKSMLSRKLEPERRKASGSFISSGLTISQPGDAAEREAYAVAEQVVGSGRTTTLPNSGTFVSSAVQRKCAECEREEKEQSVHRKETTTAAPVTGSFALKSQLEAARGQGSALPDQTRHQMESAFGADFGGVRLHTDSQAVMLSRQLNAHAFTYGQDIFFNSGKYDSRSTDGQKLLAHELTHVVQQSGSVQRQIQRQTQVKVTVDNVPGACSLDQHHKIEPAVRQATTWLQGTLRRLDNFISTPAREPGVQAALERHFHSSTPETAGRVRRILNRINSEILTRPDLQVECHTATDTSCSSAGAYVTGNLLAFCPNYFEGSAGWQASTLIHEMAHTLTGVTDITDRAYRNDRYYAQESPIEALTNAAAYEYFCVEIGSGTVQASMAPRDELNDCSDRQAIPARRSIAMFERWNRNAQVLTDDQRPGMLSQWQDLQTRHLGGTTAAHIRRAKAAYDRIYNRMKSALTFECERHCDENVSGYYRYFLFITSDTLHLCPLLFSLNEDDRTLEMYKLVLIRYGDVSEAVAAELASMAHSLTNRFWAVPASLTGFD